MIFFSLLWFKDKGIYSLDAFLDSFFSGNHGDSRFNMKLSELSLSNTSVSDIKYVSFLVSSSCWKRVLSCRHMWLRPSFRQEVIIWENSQCSFNIWLVGKKRWLTRLLREAVSWKTNETNEIIFSINRNHLSPKSWLYLPQNLQPTCSQFARINDEEKLHIFTFEKLEAVDLDHFCLFLLKKRTEKTNWSSKSLPFVSVYWLIF